MDWSDLQMTDSHRWQREVVVQLHNLVNGDVLVQRFLELPTARRRDLASMLPKARLFVLSVESPVERRYLCGMDKDALLRVIAHGIGKVAQRHLRAAFRYIELSSQFLGK